MDKDKPITLSDADISSEPSVNRRSLLGTLGIGAGVAAAAVFGATVPVQAQRGSDPEGRGRRCPYRDSDVRPNGNAFDTIRQVCGLSDRD